MDNINDLFLLAQQQQQAPQGPVGGGIIGVFIAIAYIIMLILKSIGQVKAVSQQDQSSFRPRTLLSDDSGAEPKPKRSRKRQRPVEKLTPETQSEPTRRKALARELNPQGEGTRFDAQPGTLDESQIVAPSIEPTVKPQLESLTGVFETQTENMSQQSGINLQQLLTTPDGIRQAILLAEIMKRPEF